MITVTNLAIRFPGNKRTRQRLINRVLHQHSTPANYFWAIRDISFHIADGERVGIIGPNGSGKSTLLRAIAGIYPPDEGSVTLTNQNEAMLFSLGTGFMPDLTGKDNIKLAAALLGLTPSQIKSALPSIIEFADLGSFINKSLRTYSSGMSARLAFSISITARCQILLIDETLGVGDQHFRAKCESALTTLLSDKTVLIVSHSMEQIAQLTDRCIWLDSGHLIATGSTPSIIARYLASEPACTLPITTDSGIIMEAPTSI